MSTKLPNLRHFEYLIALHKHQHFHKAADACFASQSTLSAAILKLEEQLECQLLERDNKSFIFTSDGEAVVEKARQLLTDTHELVDFARTQGKPGTGHIRLGCIPTIAPFLLTDVVARCQQQMPLLSLFIVEDTTENLMSALHDGGVDIALLALPVEKHGFRSKVLGQDPFYYAGNPEYIQRLVTSGNYGQLPEQSVFLLSSENCLTDHAVSACRLADTSRIHPFHPTSMATLVQMTAHHNGLTFLPKMAIDKGVGQIEALTTEPVGEGIYREIGMLWRETSLRSGTYKLLCDLVSEILK